MATVVDINEYKPHFTIETESAVHVIPESLLQEVADGRKTFNDIEMGDEIASIIVQDWLDSFGEQ